MSGPDTSEDAPGAPLQAALKRLTSPTAGVLLVVLIVGVLVAAISAASLQRRDPAYESSQALLIDQPKALVAAPSGDLIAKLSTLRVKYVSLLRSDAVISPAADELGLPPGAVAGSVRALAPAESLLLVVIGRSGDAEAAQDIAAAVGGSLADYLAAEQAELGVPEADQVTLTPLREASAANKVEPSARRSLSVGLVGGAVVALLLYLILSVAPGLTRRSSLFR